MDSCLQFCDVYHTWCKTFDQLVDFLGLPVTSTVAPIGFNASLRNLGQSKANMINAAYIFSCVGWTHELVQGQCLWAEAPVSRKAPDFLWKSGGVSVSGAREGLRGRRFGKLEEGSAWRSFICMLAVWLLVKTLTFCLEAWSRNTLSIHLFASVGLFPHCQVCTLLTESRW